MGKFSPDSKSLFLISHGRRGGNGCSVYRNYCMRTREQKLDKKEVMRTSLPTDFCITLVPFLVGCFLQWRFAEQIFLVATVVLAIAGLSWPLSATVPTGARMLAAWYASSFEAEVRLNQHQIHLRWKILWGLYGCVYTRALSAAKHTSRNSILLSCWLLVSWDHFVLPSSSFSVCTDTIRLALSRPVTTIKSGEMGPTQNIELTFKLIPFHSTLTSKHY